MNSFYQNRDRDFLCSVSNNLNYPAHLHKQVELVYVLSGTIRITIYDISTDLFSGELSISFPNTIHSLKTIDQSQIILIIFDISLLDNHANNLLNFKPKSPFLPADNVHKDILYSIHALLDMDKSNLNYILIKGYLTIMLCRLFENMELIEISHDSLNLIQQVLVYIDNHFTESLTLDNVAKQLNTSKFHISHIFTQKLATTFNQYINSKRVTLAQYLLLNSDLLITEIGFRSGFDSMRTFYRAFRDNSNMTPREYRDKLIQS